jgi:hypothetical protein
VIARRKLATLSFLLGFLLAAVFGAFCRADEAEAPKQAEAKHDPFLRVRNDDAGKPLAMETAIVSYVPADGKNPGLVVHLVGAVHVGEKSYYEKLNELFKQYDVLLYELVAAEGDVPKAGAERESELRGAGAIMGLQAGMKGVLKLEHQLEQIDYTAENFVHADMSPSEFARSMRDRDESFLKLFLRMMGQGMAQQSGNPDAPTDRELFAALLSKDRALEMKRIFARQFSDLGGQIAALEGPKGSTLITERNKKALEVLRREIEAGNKRIGIFYGAGHLADMEQRLAADFGLKRESEKWIEAWDLRAKDSAGEPEKRTGPLRAILKALQE